MSITATAPGKLMLMGEHAVVYGFPCLVTAVDLRYRVTLTPTNDDTVTITTAQLDAPRTIPLSATGAEPPRETAFVEAVIARFRDHVGLANGFTLTTDGPEISYGLGSSSAVTVATAAVLNRFVGAGLDERGLFDTCYGAVIDVQGRGSGYDVASAIYGGTIYYRKEPFTVARLASAPSLVIGYSGRKVGTVGLVKGVADLRTRFPALMDPVFDTIGATVDAGHKALAEGNTATFGALTNLHSGLTDALGVNTGTLSRLVYAARDAGALGAKLSGAGGGDCMFALVTDATRAPVAAAITDAGGRVVRLAVDALGVAVG